jgi:hypothetical protein
LDIKSKKIWLVERLKPIKHEALIQIPEPHGAGYGGML